jgi:methionyl-tRNA formyltransferase
VKVLVLSPYPARIAGTLAREGDTVMSWTDPIDRAFLAENMIDWVVSYGYRHILKPEVVAACEDRIVNLHISLLPWNRGKDPNFWSFFDGTPKGVTIHRIDDGIDSGPVLVQRGVRFAESETLATSYARLRGEMDSLFDKVWRDVKDGRYTIRPHFGAGSYHRARDKDAYFESLPLGWGTPTADVEALGRRVRAAGGKDAATGRALE